MLQRTETQNQPKGATRWTWYLFPTPAKKLARSLFYTVTPDIFNVSTANFPVDSDIIGPGSYFSQTNTSFLDL